jgi:pimeloyl-ACP methyl ester carboxylesterase
MKTACAVAGGMAAMTVTLGVVGLRIAKKLTAPVTERTYDLTIREVENSGSRRIVVLDRNSRTMSPGHYSLLLRSGEVVRLSDAVEDRGPDMVGRAVLSGREETLDQGMRASWSGINFLSPAAAGLKASNVEVMTAVGPAPAWRIAGDRAPWNVWAIHIHGLGSPRAGTLRGVQVAADAGLTSLVVSYRNDREGPSVGSGRSELGSSEVDDVRAAVRLARESGAEQIVLFGWSMGGAIALQLADDPEFRDVITGLVLDSPIVDWVSTIKANCVRAGLPARLGSLAVPWLVSRRLSRVTGIPTPIHLREFDWIARARELAVPTLILHGRADTSSPFELSARLRSLRPDLVHLEAFDADHTMSWNSDRERWRRVVSAWLARSQVDVAKPVRP